MTKAEQNVNQVLFVVYNGHKKAPLSYCTYYANWL